MSTRALAVRAWGVNPLVSEEVNKPMLDEDGYLPENTERGHRRCAVSAGAPVCGALYQCAAMGRALGAAGAAGRPRWLGVAGHLGH